MESEFITHEELSRLGDWLTEDPDQRRMRVQRSITPDKYLVVLEIGDHGHGKASHYGKDVTVEGSIQGALDAWDGNNILGSPGPGGVA